LRPHSMQKRALLIATGVPHWGQKRRFMIPTEAGFERSPDSPWSSSNKSRAEPIGSLQHRRPAAERYSIENGPPPPALISRTNRAANWMEPHAGNPSSHLHLASAIVAVGRWPTLVA
jgi:hypothetical protein